MNTEKVEVTAPVTLPGIGGIVHHTYAIAGVTLRTDRMLPEAVLKYMRDWAKDPCWDIVGHPEFREYDVELDNFADLYQDSADAKYEEKLVRLSSLRDAKEEYVRGNADNAQARALLIIAESLQTLAEVAETWLDDKPDDDASANAWANQLLKAVQDIAFHSTPSR